MRPLLVATRSRGKQADFMALLSDCGWQIVFPDQVGLVESADESDIERYDSFEENARAKARWFAERSGLPTLADDSGLEVDALGGGPGVRSKRFAGQDGADDDVAAANVRLLLARLAGIRLERRTARYRTVLVLRSRAGAGDWHEVTAHGTVEGHIALEPAGTGGFGYDPVFVATELRLTFAQASTASRYAVSHRARAVAALGPALRAMAG